MVSLYFLLFNLLYTPLPIYAKNAINTNIRITFSYLSTQTPTTSQLSDNRKPVYTSKIFHNIEPNKVKTEKTKKGILATPAGKDINVLAIGINLPNSTNPFPYLSNSLNENSISDSSIKRYLPYLFKKFVTAFSPYLPTK